MRTRLEEVAEANELMPAGLRAGGEVKVRVESTAEAGVMGIFGSCRE